ncbi:hypothetical protein [Vibrio mediterranei]|uniref:hypothetical protein n=1 Tax=Vibrio mediterranei TaxID=689 RepID=UPI001EFD76ED|nr:hypothetical protein [Vibrio mediterranei]MCG9657646.1 hypothetical protein [Vibrio mediterranei]
MQTIHFVDAENIGLTACRALKADSLDHVFVFSLSIDVEHWCRQQRWHYLNEYVVGANQADFALMAELGKQLTLAGSTAFERYWKLHSQDKALRQAFRSVCQTYRVLARYSPEAAQDKSATLAAPETVKSESDKKDNPHTAPAVPPKALPDHSDNALQARFLAALPAAFNAALMKKLGLAQPAFSRLTASCIKAGLIERDKSQRTLWRRVKGGKSS